MSTNSVPPATDNSDAGVASLRLGRRWAETVVLVAVLLVAGWFLLGAQDIQSRSGEVVGPRTFPTALAVMLLVVTGLALIRAMRLPADEPLTVRRPWAILSAMGLLLAFPWIVETFGYYVIIVPWVLAFGWAARVRSPFLVAITLATVLFVAVVIFQMVLGTPLP